MSGNDKGSQTEYPNGIIKPNLAIAVSKILELVQFNRDFKGLFDEILGIISHRMGIQNIGLFHYDREKAKLLLNTGSGIFDKGAYSDGVQFQDGSSIALTEKAILKAVLDRLGQNPSTGGIAKWIHDEVRPWGLIVACSQSGDLFSAHEEQFFEDVANILSMSIRNDRLSRQVLARSDLEEVLIASEERFRYLIDNIDDLVFTHWPTHDVFLGEPLDVNQTACHVLGYSKDELLMADTKIISKSEESKLPGIRADLDLGKSVRFEIDLTTRDGRRIPMEFSSKMIELDGMPAILSVARDIRHRVR